MNNYSQSPQKPSNKFSTKPNFALKPMGVRKATGHSQVPMQTPNKDL